VAVLLGWLVADEALTPALVGGLAVILAGVALVRASAVLGLPGAGAGKELARTERAFTLKKVQPHVDAVDVPEQ